MLLIPISQKEIDRILSWEIVDTYSLMLTTTEKVSYYSRSFILSSFYCSLLEGIRCTVQDLRFPQVPWKVIWFMWTTVESKIWLNWNSWGSASQVSRHTAGGQPHRWDGKQLGVSLTGESANSWGSASQVSRQTAGGQPHRWVGKQLGVSLTGESSEGQFYKWVSWQRVN